MLIGNKIKGFRTEKGYSCIQVADALGISESTYRRYETNKSQPDIDAIGKMADFFEKSIYDFFLSKFSNTTTIKQVELQFL